MKRGGGGGMIRITTKPQYLLENKNAIKMMHTNIKNTHTYTRKYIHIHKKIQTRTMLFDFVFYRL